MARMKADRLGSWIKILAALLMVAVIIVLLIQIRNTRQEYDRLAALTPEPTLSPPDLAFTQGDVLLRVGSIGPEVMELQKRLQELGYYDGIIDGKYYAGTEAAVLAFQTQHQLTADGMAGTLTLSLLSSPDAQPKSSASPAPSAGVSATPQPDAPEGTYTSPAPDTSGN